MQEKEKKNNQDAALIQLNWDMNTELEHERK